MNIVIIEDEKLASDDLVDIIRELEPSAQITAVVKSVREGVEFFQQEPEIDLIFSDIQLGDGLSFDIFRKVELTTPIVFCTAYDEYTLNAFKVNGIAYVLKPFSVASIRDALEKFRNLKKALAPSVVPVSEIMKLISERPAPKASSILVHYKDKIIPVRLEDIALFYIKNEITHLYTFDKVSYLVNKSLDELEKMTGSLFYRANRQYLVNRKAVVEASSHLSRKVSLALAVPFPDTITVSKEKLPQFLAWLSES